jgi:hypothetical protein
MSGGESILTTRKLALRVKGLLPPAVTILHLHVEEHMGGGPYCQTYRIRPVNNDAAFVGLIPTAVYGLKVYHVPFCRFCAPDSFLFTTLPRRLLVKSLDRLGRIGALWQLLARTAVERELQLPEAVPNALATFYDQNLLAFGTIYEWVDGRMWRLEMDDRIFDRLAPPPQPDYLEPREFPNEYTAKRFFLARLERLFKEMGADGLAARYSWKNWLSSQRVLLRTGSQDSYRGLVAVDFEPALGDIQRLESYLERHADWFSHEQMAAQELLALLRDVAKGTAASPVMPHSNPGAAQLLWHWSRKHPYAGLSDRLAAWARHAWYQIRLAFRLTRQPALREAWLLEQIEQGLAKGQLSETEANRIREQAADPDVQLYLHCLFVHICMLPVTPLTVLLGGSWYALWKHLGLAEGIGIVAAWLALFAVVPLSPGSLARGLYVLWVAWKRRRARRLCVALFVSFWRYVGFLAFPLQMAATFPALSRYMAGLWATRAVRMVPYYGAPGGRLEHAVFDLFFNLPLSWARRRREKKTAEASRT